MTDIDDDIFEQDAEPEIIVNTKEKSEPNTIPTPEPESGNARSIKKKQPEPESSNARSIKKKQRKKREYTPEQRAAMLDRLKRGREKSLAKRRALKEAGVKREYKTEKYIEKTLKKEALDKKTVVNNYYANDKPALDFDTFSTFMDKYNEKKIPVKQQPLEKPKPAVPIPIPPRNIKYCGINF
tara:strand:- start:7448 stop:7996 length:549 start_codon:yes stop_codon:yes gene_type:complete